MFNLTRLIPLFLIALMTGCASTPEPVAPTLPIPAQHAKLPAVRVKPAPAAFTLPAKNTVSQPVAQAAPAVLSDSQIHERVVKLLPARLKDKDGWAIDLQTAFKALQIQPSAEYFCAVIAVIEQESSFQADPVVPGLPAIVRREIEQRRDKYSIPQSVIDWMLDSKSRDGRRYQQRIDALKTEKELSDLIEEIVAHVPAGRELFPNYNQVRTGGPMQVSVEFAESHVRARHYPYPINGNLRNEVFGRRGGIYFGSAILLDYPAPYTDMLYRFADFNAGRYSSRNAAFQQALSQLSGKPLASDGDLLRYKNGSPTVEVSSTLGALLSISPDLKMNETEMRRDLLLEKLSGFNKTPLYSRLFALADKTGVKPRVALPDIDLKSPKIKRKLTTHWFAERVNGRYKSCLQQGGKTSDKTTANH